MAVGFGFQRIKPNRARPAFRGIPAFGRRLPERLGSNPHVDYEFAQIDRIGSVDSNNEFDINERRSLLVASSGVWPRTAALARTPEQPPLR